MNDKPTLIEVTDLHCSVKIENGELRPILKGINMKVRAGEVCAIMGPNGSGKSTLAQVLAGNPQFVVTGGSVTFGGKELTSLRPEERAQLGVFIGFQSPPSIPGVANDYFLRASYNALRRSRGQDALDATEFAPILQEKSAQLSMDASFLSRGVNEGFSGGEKKRNEILQMLLLEPKLAILDEIDSGVDIDALSVVTTGINKYRETNKDCAFLLITHWQRLLNSVTPDRIFVLWDGKIIKEGGKELAKQLEEEGYEGLKKEAIEATTVRV
ncbi:Fe-S cluster assembly ATPase SufC [Blattamonas nauphoetae]|uniref:Fe-S cluster assembly ATPase SufC n=1 Tax=Blattamonas nauphoetae TaxID=2049346 RepID=A0ABQ9Y490_9EUKA|nr:Fe-S cluster assembly ATPase SufC [Blattamonas nauphoetae]